MADAPRILLVDARTTMRNAAARILQEEGWHVTAVTSTPDAGEAVRRERFDALVTILQMHTRPGAFTLENIRSADPHLSIVAVTGLDEAAGAEACASIKAAVVIGEPYLAVALTDAVTAGIRATRTARQGGELEDADRSGPTLAERARRMTRRAWRTFEPIRLTAFLAVGALVMALLVGIIDAVNSHWLKTKQPGEGVRPGIRGTFDMIRHYVEGER